MLIGREKMNKLRDMIDFNENDYISVSVMDKVSFEFISMEGIGETISKVWKWIKDLISRIWNWVKSFFSKNKSKDEAAIKATEKNVAKAKEELKKNKELHIEVEIPTHTVTVTYDSDKIKKYDNNLNFNSEFSVRQLMTHMEQSKGFLKLLEDRMQKGRLILDGVDVATTVPYIDISFSKSTRTVNIFNDNDFIEYLDVYLDNIREIKKAQDILVSFFSETHDFSNRMDKIIKHAESNYDTTNPHVSNNIEKLKVFGNTLSVLYNGLSKFREIFSTMIIDLNDLCNKLRQIGKDNDITLESNMRLSKLINIENSSMESYGELLLNGQVLFNKQNKLTNSLEKLMNDKIALESLSNISLESNNPYQEAFYKLGKHAVLSKYGFANSEFNSVSMESVIEKIKETIKKIIDYIANIFRNVVAWFKKLFVSQQRTAKAIREKTKKWDLNANKPSKLQVTDKITHDGKLIGLCGHTNGASVNGHFDTMNGAAKVLFILSGHLEKAVNEENYDVDVQELVMDSMQEAGVDLTDTSNTAFIDMPSDKTVDIYPQVVAAIAEYLTSDKPNLALKDLETTIGVHEKLKNTVNNISSLSEDEKEGLLKILNEMSNMCNEISTQMKLFYSKAFNLMVDGFEAINKEINK